jgi:hypothetical protein
MSALLELVRVGLKVLVVVAVVGTMFGVVLSLIGIDFWDVYEHFVLEDPAETFRAQQFFTWLMWRLDWPFMKGIIVTYGSVWAAACVVRLSITTIQRA